MQKLVGALKAMLPHMEMVAEIMTAHGVTEEGNWWDEGDDWGLNLGSRWYRYRQDSGCSVVLIVTINHLHEDGQRSLTIGLDHNSEVVELGFSDGWSLKTCPSVAPEDGTLDAVDVQLNELCAALDKLDLSGENSNVVAREAVNMIVGFFAKLPVQAPVEEEDD